MQEVSHEMDWLKPILKLNKNHQATHPFQFPLNQYAVSTKGVRSHKLSHPLVNFMIFLPWGVIKGDLNIIQLPHGGQLKYKLKCPVETKIIL